MKIEQAILVILDDNDIAQVRLLIADIRECAASQPQYFASLASVHAFLCKLLPT